MSSETPHVESFILRFVTDVPEGGTDPAPKWHGVVVHVQNNETKTFVHLADAVAFIAHYVPIGDFVFRQDGGPLTAVSRDESARERAAEDQTE